MSSYRRQGDGENLELIMSWLGMSQYLDRLREAGFDSWETLMWITEQDLEVSIYPFYTFPSTHD